MKVHQEFLAKAFQNPSEPNVNLPDSHTNNDPRRLDDSRDCWSGYFSDAVDTVSSTPKKYRWGIVEGGR